MIKGELIILNKISLQILPNFQILKYQRKCGYDKAQGNRKKDRC